MIRNNLQEKGALTGVFVKTPATEIVELLAASGLDFICLDAEHAAWDRRSLDQCLAMSHALGLPALVRLAALRPDLMLQALDGGAAGIVAPHVKSTQDAEAFVRWAHFGPDGRGYSGSTRSAGFRGKNMAQVLSEADPFLIAQIEDADALTEVQLIAATEGLDALFIGAADLAVSLNEDSTGSTQMHKATAAIRVAAADAELAVAAFVGVASGIKKARSQGTQLLFVGSDQSLLLEGARQIAVR